MAIGNAGNGTSKVQMNDVNQSQSGNGSYQPCGSAARTEQGHARRARASGRRWIETQAAGRPAHQPSEEN